MHKLTPIAAAICLLALGGCAATASPVWDARFGDHARILTAQQLIDSGAPARNSQTIAPADGRTVREASERQAESYRTPPPTNVINIGVGGGNGR
ncbi:MAG: hypothetical protein ABI887_00265 [Burkholderiales bacterium]